MVIPPMNEQLSEKSRAAFKRIIDHRVDIAYRKDTLFAASDRLNRAYMKSEKLKERRKKASVILSIIILSGVIGTIVGVDSIEAKVIIAVLSLTAMILDVFNLKDSCPGLDDGSDHRVQAEAFVVFHKQIKSEEALIDQGVYGFDNHIKIIEILKDIEEKRLVLYEDIMVTLYEDYLVAKANIAKGQQGYTMEDYLNT